jgi:hypothetical protein
MTFDYDGYYKSLRKEHIREQKTFIDSLIYIGTLNADYYENYDKLEYEILSKYLKNSVNWHNLKIISKELINHLMFNNIITIDDINKFKTANITPDLKIKLKFYKNAYLFIVFSYFMNRTDMSLLDNVTINLLSKLQEERAEALNSVGEFDWRQTIYWLSTKF